MENQQNAQGFTVGFFTGYKQSPYPELPDILSYLNSESNITAYAFSDAENILPSTTHVVLRHATGYYRNLDSFNSLLTLLDKRGIKSINPLQLIRWNANKRYLGNLSLERLRIPKTIFFKYEEFKQPDMKQRISSLLSQFSKVVLKPVVSASGWNTYLLENSDITELKGKIDDVDCEEWMVQEFIPEIKTLGEWSVIFVGGQLLHVIKKFPAANEFKSQPEYGGTISIIDQISRPLEDAIKKEILDQLPSEPFYVRVDLIPTNPTPILIEIECIEPDLLFNDNDKILHYSELLISHINPAG